jgi:hypothetical protein
MRGSSSVGRASAFQAECRGFEPRLPLFFKMRPRSSGAEHFLGKEGVHSSNLCAGFYRVQREFGAILRERDLGTFRPQEVGRKPRGRALWAFRDKLANSLATINNVLCDKQI